MALSKILNKFSTSEDSQHIICICCFDSPVGKVTAAADDDYIFMISFEDSKNFEKKLQTINGELSCKFIEKKNKILEQLDSELEDYFAGKLKKFTVPIKTIGSDFQKQVWEKLQELSYGTTQTYGDIAKTLGRAPSHARAVGAACGANMHLLVIPCHRIVASGFNGGFSSGVDRKEWLLNHEQKHLQNP